MRGLVIAYCALTMFFAGGCVLLLAIDWRNWQVLFDLQRLGVTLAFLANMAFLWMALKRVDGRMLMAGGIIYTAVQCWLFWAGGLWTELGSLSDVLIMLFLAKGAAVFFAGRELMQP